VEEVMKRVLASLTVFVLVSCGVDSGVKLCNEATFKVSTPISYSIGNDVNKRAVNEAVAFWNSYFDKTIFVEGVSDNVIVINDKPDRVLGTAYPTTTGETLSGFKIELDSKGNSAWVIAHELGHVLGLHHTEGGLMNKYVNPSYAVTCSK
jgi:hypothetical protein